MFTDFSINAAVRVCRTHVMPRATWNSFFVVVRTLAAAGCFRSVLLVACLVSMWPAPVPAETAHRVHFKGTDAELDVYTITGSSPGPTLLLMGGIQGDEPGGYLAADLYADLTLKKGNLILVPRANFLSIVENNRGVQGDMNRKFQGAQRRADRDARVVEIIKELMSQSDFFLNLHDGSGFYSARWETPLRNPARYGQSIIADAEEYTTPEGKVVPLGKMADRALTKVNAQIDIKQHLFHFNNHRTLSEESPHKEQRLSATFHALTKVGIPAFGIETSKEISDYRLRVRYQTMAVNAFLEEFGIIPDTPRMYLDNPMLRYLIVSINDRTPVVLTGQDVLKVHSGDNIRIVHIEANYSRGLIARIRGVGESFNDLNKEVNVTRNAIIEIRKDRFLIGTLPVEVAAGRAPLATGIHVDPKINYFCVRVNDATYMVEPGRQLTVMSGDEIELLDPQTNLGEEDRGGMRLDLRGFQADPSPYPLEDRGHKINTATDLQEKYAASHGPVKIYSLQAKLNNRVFAESYLAVAEPRLEYVVLGESGGDAFVAYPGDKLELPRSMVIRIRDIKTNVAANSLLAVTMAGRTVRWQQAGSAGIDASRLTAQDVPLDVIRGGKSIGRIWLKQGEALRITSAEGRPRASPIPVRY